MNFLIQEAPRLLPIHPECDDSLELSSQKQKRVDNQTFLPLSARWLPAFQYSPRSTRLGAIALPARRMAGHRSLATSSGDAGLADRTKTDVSKGEDVTHWLI